MKIENTFLVRVYNDEIKDGHFNCPDGIRQIAESAFSYCTNLNTITMPQGVTQIGDGAFAGCTNLNTITLPQGFTWIGFSAFSYCTNLNTITMPQGVTQIGDGAFAGCTNLNTIALPQGVIWIRNSTFKDCTNLNTIILPRGVIRIGYGTFAGCTNLNTIILPQELTMIGSDAFDGCTNLKTIIIDSEDDSEINRIRSLLPTKYLQQQNVVKKSSYINWILNTKEVLSNNGLVKDVCNIITHQAISNELGFFNKKCEPLAKTEIKQDELCASDETAIFSPPSPEACDESTNQRCIIF